MQAKAPECVAIIVDGNVLTLFYVKRTDLNGRGRFTIMLDKDAWKKGGSLTAPPLAGYDMYFDKGEPGDYGNTHLKQNTKVVNTGSMVLALFKAKTFGVKTSYGKVELLARPNEDLVMYWPEDNGGDQFNNFTNILGKAKAITGDMTSIVTDLAKLAAIVM